MTASPAEKSRTMEEIPMTVFTDSSAIGVARPGIVTGGGQRLMPARKSATFGSPTSARANCLGPRGPAVPI